MATQIEDLIEHGYPNVLDADSIEQHENICCNSMGMRRAD